MTRPSIKTTGCRAVPRFRWPMHSTFEPSSSMTKSCKVCVSRLGGRNALRLLVKTTLPPGSGHGPVLKTPYSMKFLPGSGVRKSFDQLPAPVLGVNCWWVSRTILPRLDVDLVDVGTGRRSHR